MAGLPGPISTPTAAGPAAEACNTENEDVTHLGNLLEIGNRQFGFICNRIELPILQVFFSLRC